MRVPSSGSGRQLSALSGQPKNLGEEPISRKLKASPGTVLSQLARTK